MSVLLRTGCSKMEPMTHAELVQRARHWLSNTVKCRFVFCEYGERYGEVPDAIGWVKEYRNRSITYPSYLIECKISKADFMGDQGKPFRKNPMLGMGNYRYYLSEPGVIDPTWLPDQWGLLYVYSRQVKIIKDAIFIGWPVIAQNERQILCSALRRVHIRGDLAKIQDWRTIPK